MQVKRQRKYLSRSYINKFIFGYDISLSFLLIGTAILVVGISFLQLQPIIAQVQTSEANLKSTEQKHQLDGISFQIDNLNFSHHTASVNGIQLHYVIGGHGDA